MKTASLRFPDKLTTRKCWIGSYGGHFDIVVVFNSKPKKGKKGDWDEGEYSYRANRGIVAGAFGRDDFRAWFGVDIKPESTSCESVEKYELTALWHNGEIIGLNTYADR